MIVLFLAILISYLLGSIPTGFLVGKAKGIDIRKLGSGNTGATNVFRTLGKKLGIFVFVCDLLKGLIAVAVAQAITEDVVILKLANHQPSPALFGICAAIACILGHNFPVWLKFKGGKGVATSLGVVVGLVPLAALIALVVWLIAFFATRYVSVASLLATITVPIATAFLTSPADKTPLLIFTLLAALLIIARHKSNIQRLIAGTENRFEKKK